jgi:abortive infection bacteriophage resistance protein
MDLKRPLTIDEQLDRLIAHGVTIESSEFAKAFLSHNNYYRISGYALQFRDPNNPDDYISGTKFNDIVGIYNFDAELRNILKKYLDVFELYSRTQIAHHFSLAKSVKPPHDGHYDPNNFYVKSSHREIIDSAEKGTAHYADSLFVKHHIKKYNSRMPLWVIVELLSFSDLSKLYSAMFYSEQELIADQMQTVRDTLKNHLHCLANLRNKVAHSARLYNAAPFSPPASIGAVYLKKYPELKTDSLFAYIAALILRLPNVDDKRSLFYAVDNLMKATPPCVDIALLGFPKNYEEIINTIALNFYAATV